MAALIWPGIVFLDWSIYIRLIRNLPTEWAIYEQVLKNVGD